MKLKNVLFAAMIACTFASCSKDAESSINPEIPAAKGDANVTFSIALGDGVTRAEGDANALADEAKINEVQVALYKPEGGTPVATGVASGNTATLNGVPSKVDLICVVLANMPKTTLDGVKLSDLQSKTLTIPSGAAFESNNIPMYGVSAAPFSLDPGDNNKQQVKVFRNVARVQLTGLALNLNKTKYISVEEAKFEFTALSVNKAAEKAFYNGAADGSNTAFVGGDNGYGYYMKNMTELISTGADRTLVQTGETVDANKTNVRLEEKVLVTNPGETVTLPKYYFYVLANEKADSKTMLTVAGNFSLKNAVLVEDKGIENLPSAKSYYSVVLDETGIQGGTAKVEKNKVYDIKLTIAGAGSSSPNPEDGKANFSVEAVVVDWTSATQDVTIE